MGKSAYYVRAPRLLHNLAVARGDGSYGRLLARLAKAQLLAIDDWLLTPLKDSERRDLLDETGDSSCCVASQMTETRSVRCSFRSEDPPSICASKSLDSRA